MPSKKGRPEPRWLAILEDIHSQNRSTIEAVEASRVALEGRFDVLDAEMRARFAVVEAAVRNLGQDTRDLKAGLSRFDQESRSRDTSLEVAVRDLKVSVQQNSVDIRDLAGKVEALSRLEERVSALERRGA